MKILITGSQGVIGSELSKILKRKGHSVFGLGRTHIESNYGHTLGNIKNETYFKCDIAEYRELQYVIGYVQPDLVYNCAAEFGRWNGERFYERLWRSNVIGTKHLIKLQEIYGFKLVHFSSSEVYGDFQGEMNEEVLDDFPIRQLNDYAMSKWVNEMQIYNSRLQYKTKSVILRLFNTYGPGEKFHPFRSVNCLFCYNLLHNLPITVYRGHLRTSTYIGDAVETISKVCENFKDGEVYNICSDELHSIEKLAILAIKHTNADPTLISYKENEILTTIKKITESTKIKRDFGHVNTVTLDEGVKRTVDWMREYYHV